MRVVRPGGLIGLANWTPEGFVGQMFKIVGQDIPPPAGVPSPLQWGTVAGLESLLGASCDIDFTRRIFTFRFRSPEAYFETFREFCGPVLKAWATLGEPGRAALRDQLTQLADDHNRNRNGALAVDAEYLQVVAVRH